MNEKIEKIYYDSSSPSYLCTVSQLYNFVKKYCKNVTKEKINQWLNEKNEHTLFKYYRVNQRSQFVSSEIDRFWATDLLDMRNISKFNNGFNYILLVVDILSKFLWCQPLKNKFPKSIIQGFMEIFKTGRKCTVLISDAGKEYDNRVFKNFLNEMNIKLYIMRNTEVKCAPAERVIRTIKEKLMKHIYFKKDKNYLYILPHLVKNYNYSVHSRTKYKPVEVNSKNKNEVFLNLYRKRIPNKISKFIKGDKVRILKLKKTFEKGYTDRWTKEVFKIKKKLTTLPFPRFIIEDLEGKEILGTFYDFELQKLNQND